MKFIIGIDEVGRGALAGPVVVGAAMIPSEGRISFPRIFGKLKDSKKLSARQRSAWAGYLRRRRDILFVTARVYPRGIERMNISKAANHAALRAFERLLRNHHRVWDDIRRIFLDGGLYLGNGVQPEKARTIIRGDEKITAVKIASIVAKVSRDGSMTRLAKVYREYGFDIHKGYGTASHFRAIRKYGPSPVHRKSFLGNPGNKTK